jgi:hypothetical protein
MEQYVVPGVPRYYENYVNDCFATVYGAAISHQGFNPNIILADYLSFMYEEETKYIGTTYMYRYSASMEFSEEELNTSLEFARFSKTTYYSDCETVGILNDYKDRIHINFYIDDDTNVAVSRLEELINANKPVAAVVDLYYMSYHRAYLKEHGIHGIIITGYNKISGEYEIFDKYLLSSSNFDGRLPIADVVTARTSECIRTNPMVGEYKRPIRNLWMEFDVDPGFRVSEDKLFAVLQESYLRMNGLKKVNGIAVGLDRLEAFRADILKLKEKELDERTLFLFKDYYNTCLKQVARSRVRFKVFVQEISSLLPQEVSAKLIDDLQESAKRWDICANLSLKLGISKSVRLIDDLDRNLKTILEIERAIMENLNLCNLKESI